jgi:quinol monooxygenase YgiN
MVYGLQLTERSLEAVTVYLKLEAIVMIVNVATLKAKPGLEAELEATLKSFVAKVPGEEGTVVYTLHRAQNDSGQFMFYEMYKDKAAMEVHASTPDFKEIMIKKVGTLIAEKPKMNFYEVIASIDR